MSKKSGPILILEDDLEDQDLISEAFVQIKVRNKLMFFTTAAPALEYLLNTTDQPFLILTDINLPIINGLEFQNKIQENEYLRKKSIPFIFFTTTGDARVVEKAYEQQVQGFFQKPAGFSELTHTLSSIMDYWTRCLHPNTPKF